MGVISPYPTVIIVITEKYSEFMYLDPHSLLIYSVYESQLAYPSSFSISPMKWNPHPHICAIIIIITISLERVSVFGNLWASW